MFEKLKNIRFFNWLRFQYLYAATMITKRCYYGPFTGEFGHLLGHNLPFIYHLYSKGVKVEFCGLEIHRCFFFDEKGNSLVNNYVAVRDFFSESLPDCNGADEPNDVKKISENFVRTAKKSFYPYWDNSDIGYYFGFFRWEILRKGYNKAVDLSKVYKTADEDSVVIFPRKPKMDTPERIQQQIRNNGQNWDYRLVAETAAKVYSKVYVIGHPVFSAVDFGSFGNVEVILTNDNRVILEKCSNSQLIITQHSGTVYLGEYTDCPVLIIYKGGKEIGDIDTTIQFKNGLGRQYDLNYAFSIEEIELFLIKKKNETFRNQLLA